jgi:hypothetical protein
MSTLTLTFHKPLTFYFFFNLYFIELLSLEKLYFPFISYKQLVNDVQESISKLWYLNPGLVVIKFPIKQYGTSIEMPNIWHNRTFFIQKM